MADSTVAVITRMTAPLPPDAQAVWDSLIPGFSEEVPHPERAQLVITDQFAQVVHEYSERSPTEASRAGAAPSYTSLKPDRAIAVAKTIDLPDNKAVVIAPATLINLGEDIAGRMLRHEAQHVRLIQDDDSALTVHHRVNLARPSDLSWIFVWIAEIVVDEYRCELATYEPDTSNVYTDSNATVYADIVAAFKVARYDLNQTGDVSDAYHRAFAALQRLGVFLAYGAASIENDSTRAANWVSVPQMAGLYDIISSTPSATSKVEDEQLAALCIEIARQLRRILQRMGLDCYPIHGGDYFAAL